MVSKKNLNKGHNKKPCWVIKIGSALLTADGKGLDEQAIASWVKQMAQLQNQGIHIVLVSSGAVAAGMQRLGWTKRPHALYQQQAAAAIGQMGLIQLYESKFQQFDLHTAQILLTHEDLSNRKRYLNARGTLRQVLKLNVIPVINENDTVATDEIRFGDNDSLAAMVANLVEADRMVILTDQEGLFDRDPRKHSDATLIEKAEAGSAELEGYAGDSGSLGRGGMLTKIRAAERAARSGASTHIVNGHTENILLRLHKGEAHGTLLQPTSGRVAARKQWLATHMQSCGDLLLDNGAVKVLRESGRSLLPVGVTAVNGTFARGDMVRCLDQQGREVAHGLINYSSNEAEKIIGHASDRIESILGYVDEAELIHRDNMVVF
ncbi:MAG: glutamate 5-kinase [Pseudomonadota bacterium]|nr:glutamate 5-kinase [Pseudomonadota bacterium]